MLNFCTKNVRFTECSMLDLSGSQLTHRCIFVGSCW